MECQKRQNIKNPLFRASEHNSYCTLKIFCESYLQVLVFKLM